MKQSRPNTLAFLFVESKQSKWTNSLKHQWVLPSDVLTAASDSDCSPLVILTCPFLTSVLAATPTPDTRSLGGLPVPFLEDSLNIHYNFSDRTLTVSLNLVIRFFFFFFFLIRSFTLHAVLKSYSWTSCTFPVGHLDLLQTIAYVEATFEASDFRHDRSHWSGCLGFVSSFVHLLFGLQYLFSVFQKSFVYILPLCVIWRGNFLLFVHLLLGLHSSGIGCKTFFFLVIPFNFYSRLG